MSEALEKRIIELEKRVLQLEKLVPRGCPGTHFYEAGSHTMGSEVYTCNLGHQHIGGLMGMDGRYSYTDTSASKAVKFNDALKYTQVQHCEIIKALEGK